MLYDEENVFGLLEYYLTDWALFGISPRAIPSVPRSIWSVSYPVFKVNGSLFRGGFYLLYFTTSGLVGAIGSLNIRSSSVRA